MKGVGVFLVTNEDSKNVCYMEVEQTEYSDGTRYGIMARFRKNKSGFWLEGKQGEETLIKDKLIKYYRKELNLELKDVNEKIKLFNNVCD